MRFENLPTRLRETTELMAVQATIPMSLWCAHSNAALDAATKIEALERELGELKQKL